MANISQEAINLIIREEVSSEAVYRKRYTRPEWPGVQSGVTIGIGYDVGYATPARLRSDWQGRIPDSMIAALTRACGVTGQAASGLTKQLRSQVVVPWEAAIGNFRDVVLPRWIKTVTDKLPNCDKLPPDCLGALVSLAYNRGPSFGNTGDRYREMRAIRALMASGNFAGIPAQFRSMKRLWPHVPGLQGRREREAKLFERGLAKPAPRPPVTVPPPPDIPAPRDIDPEVINQTDDPLDNKPAVKSKTIWASIIGIITTIGGALTDWRVALVIVLALFLFIMADRYLKLDIKGWFRS
jgi:hypothetical protein